MAQPSHLLTFLPSPHTGQVLTCAWRFPHVVQLERYTLKKVEGRWRIDGQEIQEVRVIGRTL